MNAFLSPSRPAVVSRVSGRGFSVVLLIHAFVMTFNLQNAAGATSTLADYDFIPPAQWQVQRKPDQIMVTQTPDMLGCIIQILPPQPSSGNLEQDARAMFDLMYPGWSYTKTGDQQQVLTKGILPRGLAYCMKEAQMSITSADGRYHLEDGVALVVSVGNQVALIAVRHRGLLAHVDCLNKYETWRRFFNSFTVKNAPVTARREADPATRLVGAWAQSQSRAMSEYVFAANGHYAFAGAIGTSRTTTDLNYEYLHLKSYAFDGDGTYSIAGDTITLTKARGATGGQMRFRFEQVNHGGTGWKDRIWFLTKDKMGEVEVCYEKRAR